MSNRNSQHDVQQRPHILMITNHGLHEWEIDAGLPDTGGQNVFVNQLSATLAELGFRVTIANRGGYPHPRRGTMRTGESRRGEQERIVYLQDSISEFVRKEDMADRTDELGRSLARIVDEPVDLIISHYWDSAQVGETYRAETQTESPHVWFPHSLGVLKEQHSTGEEQRALRLAERIDHERSVISRVDQVAVTSTAMRQTLRKGYGYRDPLFLPPCVDTGRFFPEVAKFDQSAVDLIAETLGCDRDRVLGAPIVSEVSRTDRTKRKDILIRSFARIKAQNPGALLAVTIDESRTEIYGQLTQLIRELDLVDSVAVLGSIWEYVPSLYGISQVYCTPSIMEGFGMSIQEAAACRVPAVATTRVPFAAEYLLGDSPMTSTVEADGSTLRLGAGAIVADPDSVDGIAEGLSRLLGDPELRRRMGEAAFDITIPEFTWERATLSFLREAGVSVPRPNHVEGGSE